MCNLQAWHPLPVGVPGGGRQAALAVVRSAEARLIQVDAVGDIREALLQVSPKMYADARAEFSWEKQFELALDPEKARETKGRIAFYGSTPAYRPVLDHHGWGDAQTELNTLSKRGAEVAYAEVYRRERPESDPAGVAELGRVAAPERIDR